ncbi:hypothetical protein D3C80_1205670 [compost metagenome]
MVLVVNFGDRFFPFGLVRNLAAHGIKADRADNRIGFEVLELCAICPCLFCQLDKHLCAIKISVVIGGDIGDKVRRAVGGNFTVADKELGVIAHCCSSSYAAE